MWDLTVYPYLQMVRRFLICFHLDSQRTFYWRKERALAYLDSHGRPWVEETAKHLYSPTGRWIWILLKNAWLLQEGYQEVLSHLNLCLLWSDKGGLGFGSCESLGWAIIPFVVAEMPFLNSVSGQKFSNVALTKTSFYLVTLWEERMGWDGI